jgi:hypothetical protein
MAKTKCRETVCRYLNFSGKWRPETCKLMYDGDTMICQAVWDEWIVIKPKAILASLRRQGLIWYQHDRRPAEMVRQRHSIMAMPMRYFLPAGLALIILGLAAIVVSASQRHSPPVKADCPHEDSIKNWDSLTIDERIAAQEAQSERAATCFRQRAAAEATRPLPRRGDRWGWIAAGRPRAPSCGSGPQSPDYPVPLWCGKRVS